MNRCAAKMINRLRLFRAQRMHKTVRFKIGELHEFYAEMNAENIPYCVLRWADDVPFSGERDDAYSHDVDHLIGRHTISNICRLASERPGPAKCDFYSINGERGSAYATMPYLTPALAAKILRHRTRDEYPFYVPNTRDSFFSFAYHLVYHKGAESGIPTGIDGIKTNGPPVRDYLTELFRLAKIAEIPLKHDVSLLSIHELLRKHRWNMPLDLMVRWPRKHAVLRALMIHDQVLLRPLVDKAQGIYVFVLRSQSRVSNDQKLAVEMISNRFDVLDTRVLNEYQVESLSRLTRGGNWYEKSHIHPIPPTDIIVCREHANRGPLPNGMSAQKIAKRYPEILNTDVLIKREIRSALRKIQIRPENPTLVHATDNPTETVETLLAIMHEEIEKYLTFLNKKAEIVNVVQER